jgi:hypothetical protein
VDVASAIIAHAERWLAKRKQRKHKRHTPLDDERRMSRIRDDGAPASSRSGARLSGSG